MFLVIVYVDGKCETLREGETTIFLCKLEEFDFFDCETETDGSSLLTMMLFIYFTERDKFRQI